MVPVYRALVARDWCTPVLLLTGQHRDMARSVIELFGLTPDVDLDVMEPGQTLVSLATRLTGSLAETLYSYAPDAVLVQGDTTSAMIAGLLGFYANCRVGHVEAGLRTGNLSAPYPEEFNRRVLSLAAHWHFAPTSEAAANLRDEGVRDNIYVVGNTVIDAALDIAQRDSVRVNSLLARHPFLACPKRRRVLVTTHRRENFGRPMEQVGAALRILATRFTGVDFIVPVHPNPVVGEALRPSLMGLANVHLIAPLDYDEMIHVLRGAYLVLTDSGGIQEEAPAFNVPVLVLRNETERTEGIEAGCSLLVGTGLDAVVGGVTRLLEDDSAHTRMARAVNPYGDGRAAEAIADIMERSF